MFTFIGFPPEFGKYIIRLAILDEMQICRNVH